MNRSEGEPLRAVLVCPPGPAYSGVSDLASQNIAEVPDPVRAREQHAALVALLASAGARVVEIDELAGHPNATFTRDPALMTPAGYIELRMGLESRRKEPRWIAEALEGEGVPRLGVIEPPGTVEGGDVFLEGDVALLARSDRTNDDGIRQLSALLQPLGYEVRVADLSWPYLHLGTVLSVLAPRRVVAVKGVFGAAFLDGFDVVELSTPEHDMTGANVFCLNPNEVIANRSDGLGPVRVLEAHGVRVHRLDLSEFRKGNGGPTCLTLPLERA
jgi:dimethylargininase